MTLDPLLPCQNGLRPFEITQRSDEIENNLRYIIKDQNEKEVTLNAHPYLAAYFTKGLFSIRYKWWRKYKRWVKVKPVNSYHFTEYHFINGNEEEIKV